VNGYWHPDREIAMSLGMVLLSLWGLDVMFSGASGLVFQEHQSWA
jgi:hypothetical protein